MNLRAGPTAALNKSSPRATDSQGVSACYQKLDVNNLVPQLADAVVETDHLYGPVHRVPEPITISGNDLEL